MKQPSRRLTSIQWTWNQYFHSKSYLFDILKIIGSNLSSVTRDHAQFRRIKIRTCLVFTRLLTNKLVICKINYFRDLKVQSAKIYL